MAVAFVGAGTGVIALTGTGTVSKTGCTAGNLLLVHLLSRGNTEDWSAFSAETNISDIDGALGNLRGVLSGQGVGNPTTSRESLFVGRATANGTCSAEFTVGASGEDLLCRMYEFSGASLGTTLAEILELGSGLADSWFGTGTTISSGVDMTTNGADRFAVVLVGLDNDLALGDFTGEGSGLDLTELVAEYQETTGANGTLQIQGGTIATAGVRSIGSAAVSSCGWGVLQTNIIPFVTAPSGTASRMMTLGVG